MKREDIINSLFDNELMKNNSEFNKKIIDIITNNAEYKDMIELIVLYEDINNKSIKKLVYLIDTLHNDIIAINKELEKLIKNQNQNKNKNFIFGDNKDIKSFIIFMVIIILSLLSLFEIDISSIVKLLKFL